MLVVLESVSYKMVSIGLYPCFCSDGGLKRFKVKDGRYFLKCGSDTCALLLPEERYRELTRAYKTKVCTVFKPNKFPLCQCGKMVSLWVSHSYANPNRPYFRCKEMNSDTRCGFFQWADITTKREIVLEQYNYEIFSQQLIVHASFE